MANGIPDKFRTYKEANDAIAECRGWDNPTILKIEGEGDAYYVVKLNSNPHYPIYIGTN